MDTGNSDTLDISSILPRRVPPTLPDEPTPSAIPANNPQAAEAARAKIASLLGQSNTARANSSGAFDIRQLKNPGHPPASAQPLPAQAPETPTAIPPTPQPALSTTVTNSSEKSMEHSCQIPPAQTWHQPTVESIPPQEQPSQPTGKQIPVGRKLPSRLKPILSALASFALLFAIFKAPVFLTQLRFAFDKPQASEPAPVTPAAVAATHSEPTLEIPKINVSAPVVFEPSIAEEAVQKSLQNGVVHYGISVQPGEAGNSVIVGHSSNDWWEPGNYKFVFVLLDKLIVGDTFSMDYEGKKYIYEVYETKVVEPTDVSVLAHTPEPTMTLITCTPPGTSWKRLVIKAKQISPDPGQIKEANPRLAEEGANILPSNAPSLSNQLRRLWDNFRRLFGADVNEEPINGDPGMPEQLPSGL